MKRIIWTIASGLAVLFLGAVCALWLWIDHDVKDNIRVVKKQYAGTAEDALIAYLLDDKNSYYSRSGIAIWTLGQIHSQKALPVIKGFYKNDPKGKTCKGQHSYVLCQHEMYNAIRAIEGNGWLLHARRNK